MSKQFIKDYFTFSNAERRGIIILVIFILLILAFRLILPFLSERTDSETTTFEVEVKQWLRAYTENDLIQIHSDIKENTENIRFTSFDFDPNLISSDEIRKLGVSNNVRIAWVNYRAKGGIFYTKEDLKKIYGLDSNTYRRLEPFIITGIEYNHQLTGIKQVHKNDRFIELNSATQTEFEYLRGIGPVLAERICKYRNLLGGYSNIGQLAEVFGMTDSIVMVNENLLSVDKLKIEKINLNKADFRILSRHPYISDYEAKALIHYREMKGFIESFNELVINNLISDSVLAKLTDYLTLKEL